MADVSKQEYRERRRKEVHESLMAQTKKRGFLTPERKKKLRKLIREFAMREIQAQMAKKAVERKKIIEQRSGQPKNIANADESTLKAICNEYHNRIYKLQEDKWDLELATNLKELEVNELKERVNDLRGKFIVPPLKKVSKYATQLEKMRQWTYKLAKMDMRGALKPVKKELELDEKLPKKENKPEWASNPATKPTTPTTPSPYKTASMVDLSNNKKTEKEEEKDDEEEEEDEDEEDEDMGEEVEEVELRKNY